MSYKLYGTVDGVIICNQKRSNELNERINERNVVKNEMQPYFTPRAVSTKFQIFPSIDKHNDEEKLRAYKPYREVSLNSGTSAPWSGYSHNINTESSLRNQFFALQNSEQSVYVPSSKSDLYKPYIPPSQNTKQPFPYLFSKPTFDKFNPNTLNVGKQVLNNSTRTQRLDASC